MELSKSALKSLVRNIAREGWSDKKINDFVDSLWREKWMWPDEVIYGYVTWEGGLDFIGSRAKYRINNQLYTTRNTKTYFTLDAADPLLPRIDLITLNTQRNWEIIKGVPAENPLRPTYNRDTNIEVTFIEVPAGATAISGVTDKTIYNEHTAGEWAVSAIGTTANADYTTNPSKGTKCIQVGAVENADKVIFTAAAPEVPTGWGLLSLDIRLSDTNTTGNNLFVYFASSGAPCSNRVQAAFARGINTWQTIMLPFDGFNVTASFDELVLEWENTTETAYTGLYIDNVFLQKGIPLPETTDTFTTGFDFNSTTGDLTLRQNNNRADLVANIAAYIQDKVDQGVPFKKTGWQPNAWEIVTVSNSGRTITLTPVSGSYSYWIQGTEYIKSVAESVTISDTTGQWYVYYDGETLTASQTPWSILEDNYAFVTACYWNATQQSMIVKCWELHTYAMGPSEHYWMHTSIGTRYAGGLAVTQNGTNNWKINVTEGTIIDEDIPAFINEAAPTGVFGQKLTMLEAPKLYKYGASEWRQENAVPSNIVSLDGSNQVYYNQLVTGNWQLTATTVNKYVCMWLVAFTDFDDPVKWIIGQYVSNTLAESLSANTVESLNFSGLPAPEKRIIARVIVKNTDTSPYYEIAQIDPMQTDDIIPGGDVTNDSYVTGVTFDSGTRDLTLTRNNGLPSLSITITTEKPIQVTGLTLSSGSWSLVSGLYEYSLSNVNITANSIVEVIPVNADIATVIAAVILPETDSSSGSVKIYAQNAPSGNIGVTINIWEKQ